MQRAGCALDCGCGAGDNARLLVSWGWDVVGITLSPDERSSASKFCRSTYLHDLESGIPGNAKGPFDLIVLSHVLEHLLNPGRVLQDAQRVLVPNGVVAVALPNVLNWRYRRQFVLGRFEYEEGGIMDNTHVRFYTYESGKRLLEANGFRVIVSTVDGSFPLRYVRKALPRAARYIDGLACQLWPGLFGWQLLYIACATRLSATH